MTTQTRRGFLTNVAAAGAASLVAPFISSSAHSAPVDPARVDPAPGDLLWFRHLGRSDGSAKWANRGKPTIVGSSWGGFTQVSAADNGVIYATDTLNNLHWYQHLGRSNGAPDFNHAVLGSGWGSTHLFAADDSVIYVVLAAPKFDLHWYQHLGRSDGSAKFGNHGTAKTVGTGWDFQHAFAANDGVIYGINDGGDLFWYRHIGRSDGKATFDRRSGTKLAENWNLYIDVCAASDGVIYGLTASGDLYWTRHTGRSDGTAKLSEAVLIASGWNYSRIFAAEDSVVYAVV